MNIHRWVHYLLCGNAATIYFDNQSSLLHEPASDDEHWLKGMGFWSVLLSTISGHCKVYLKEYIHM